MSEPSDLIIVAILSTDGDLMARSHVQARWSCGACYPLAPQATVPIDRAGRIRQIVYSIPALDLTFEFQESAVRDLYGRRLVAGSSVSLIWGARPFLRIHQEENEP